MDSQIIAELRDLISKGQLPFVLDELSTKNLSKEFNVRLIQLHARFSALENEIFAGTISGDESTRKRNQICQDLLYFLQEIENPRFKQKSFFSGLKNAYRKTLWIVGGFGIIMGLIIGLDITIDTLEHWGIFKEKPITPSIFANDSAYHILLLPFGPDGNCNLESNQYHWQVKKRLLELNENNILGIEVRHQDTIMCDILDVDTVKAYGKRNGADLVIYGNYQERCEWDTTLLNIRYVLITNRVYGADIFLKGEEEYAINEKESLVELSNGNLTGRVEDVIFWALGIKAMRHNNYKKAARYLENISIPEGKKEYSIVASFLFGLYAESGNYKEAYNYFIKSDELEDSSFSKELNYGLFDIHSQFENCEGVEVTNQKIEEDNPHEDVVYLYLCRGNAFMIKGWFNAAIADYNCVIEASSKDKELSLFLISEAYFFRGNAYRKLSQYKRAIADYTCAIEFNPRDAIAYYNRGTIFRTLGDSIQASRDLYLADSVNLEVFIEMAEIRNGGVFD